MDKKNRYILKIEKNDSDYYTVKTRKYCLILNDLLIDSGEAKPKEIYDKYIDKYNPIISFVERSKLG